MFLRVVTLALEQVTLQDISKIGQYHKTTKGKLEHGHIYWDVTYIYEIILSLRPTNERRRYFVTTSLIGWAQA